MTDFPSERLKAKRLVSGQPVDWAAYWRKLVEDREAQAQRLREHAGLPAGSYWDRRAEGFRRATQSRADETDPLIERVLSHLTPESTVLDVGAGVGRHALELAKTARWVTAVEPSEGMRSILQAEAAERGIRNLTVVPSTWEAAEVEPCDVAICSHVVYTAPDIRLFLEKLQDKSRRYCFMTIRTVQRELFLEDLWQRLHGERVPEPGAIELFNALHQCVGIVANLEIVPFRIGRASLATFASFEEALDSIREQLYLALGDPRESLVREYLEANLIQEGERLVLPGPSIGAAILWWSNEPGHSPSRG